MAFKPISKSDTLAKIKNYLLEGFILRVDSRDETPIEVIDRAYIKQVPNMPNIGQFSGTLTESINCSHELLHGIVKELKEDYSVRRVWCSFSGCCQYSTYAYYID